MISASRIICCIYRWCLPVTWSWFSNLELDVSWCFSLYICIISSEFNTEAHIIHGLFYIGLGEAGHWADVLISSMQPLVQYACFVTSIHLSLSIHAASCFKHVLLLWLGWPSWPHQQRSKFLVLIAEFTLHLWCGNWDWHYKFYLCTSIDVSSMQCHFWKQIIHRYFVFHVTSLVWGWYWKWGPNIWVNTFYMAPFHTTHSSHIRAVIGMRVVCVGVVICWCKRASTTQSCWVAELMASHWSPGALSCAYIR